jgi:DNA-binding beta-propeller fold protein YncE
MAALVLCMGAGCEGDPHNAGRLEAVWGRRGQSEGRFQKPRAMAIDAQNRIYVVDMTARIQVFDARGHYLRCWQTPEHTAGRPTGMSIARNGNLLVADTHYHRVLIYSPQGKLLRTLGGHKGQGPGEFGLVTDVVEDSQGNLYVGEYGDCDRIQKLSADGRFLLEWGGHGAEPGRFARPQGLAIDREDHLWVADAGNHRIQVFDSSGKLLQFWGSQGHGLGQLYYPYDVVLASDGNVYVVEYGNSRVQKFTPDGRSLGCWGTEGRGEGRLFNPWAAVCDSGGSLHVLDTNNHRVEKIRM